LGLYSYKKIVGLDTQHELEAFEKEISDAKVTEFLKDFIADLAVKIIFISLSLTFWPRPIY